MRASKLASLATLVATVGLAVLLAFASVDASPLAITTANEARNTWTCCDCVGGNCLPRCCDDVKSTLNALALRAFYGVEAPRGHLKQDQDKSTPFATRSLAEASTMPAAARALDHAGAMTNILDVRGPSKEEQVRALDLDYAAGTADGCNFAYCQQDGHVVDEVARAVPDRVNNANPLSARDVNARQVDPQTITNVAQLDSRDDNDYDPCYGCPCAGVGGCSPACCYIAKRSFYGLLGLTPAAASPDPAARDVTLGQTGSRTATQVTQLVTRGDDPPDDPPVCYGCPCAGTVGVCSPACCYNAKRSFYGLLGLTPASAAPELAAQLAAQLAARDVSLHQADPRTAIHEVIPLARRGDSPPDPPECCACNEYFCSHACCAASAEEKINFLATRTVNGIEASHPEAALVPKALKVEVKRDRYSDNGLGCNCSPYTCSPSCCADFKENDVKIFHTIRALPGFEAPHAAAFLTPKDLKEEVRRDVCSENGLGCSCTAYTCSPLCCAASKEEDIDVSSVMGALPTVEDAHAEASLVPKEVNQCGGLGCPCDPYSCSEFCCGTSEETDTAISPVIRTADGIEVADPEAALVPKDLNKADKRDYCSQHGLGCECGAGWCSEDCCATSQAKTIDAAPAVYTFHPAHPETTLVSKDLKAEKRDYCGEHGYGCQCYVGVCSPSCCATSEGTRSLEIAPAPELATRDVRVEHVEPRDASFGYLVPKGLSRDEKRDYCSKHGYGCFCSSSGICAHACCLSSEEQARATDNAPVTRALHGIEAAHLEARDGAQDKSKSTMSAFLPRSSDSVAAAELAISEPKAGKVDSRSLSKEAHLGGSLKAAKRQGCLGGACPCDPNGAYCSFECCTTKGMDGRALHGDQPRRNDVARALLLDPVQPEEQLHERKQPAPRDVKAGLVDPRALAQDSGLKIGVFERRSQGDSGCCTCIPVGGCLLECCATSSVVSKETAPELVRALDGEKAAAPRVLSGGKGPHEEPTREQ